jgi:hypothetical protein
MGNTLILTYWSLKDYSFSRVLRCLAESRVSETMSLASN